MAKRTYNRRGRTTAKTPVRNDGRGRAQRQKAAQVARDTGSKDRVTRGRGVTRTATGAPRGAQGPAKPPVQGPMRKVSGLLGKRKLRPSGGPALAQAVGLEIASRMAETIGKPGQSRMSKLGIQGPAKPVKPKKPMASMGSDYKEKETKLSRAAGAANFDAAFAKARKAGKKTFTWRGKRYNTKLKGE